MPNNDNQTPSEPEKKLIRSGDGFRVYLSPAPDMEVSWEIDDEAKLSKEAFALLSRAKIAGAIPMSYMPVDKIKAWKYMVGQGVALGIVGDLEEAAKVIDGADRFIAARASEVAKMWYLQAVFIVLVFLLLVAAVVTIASNYLEGDQNNVETKFDTEIQTAVGLVAEAVSKRDKEVEAANSELNIQIDKAATEFEAKMRLMGEAGKSEDETTVLKAELDAIKTTSELERIKAQQAILELQAKHASLIANAEVKVGQLRDEVASARIRGIAFDSLASFQVVVLTLLGGALGAAFSLMTRLGKMGVDPASGKSAHIAEVAFRITVGILASSIIVIAMKANMVFGFTATASSGSQVWMLLILAIAAGASERLVPSVLEQVESKIESGKDYRNSENESLVDRL